MRYPNHTFFKVIAHQFSSFVPSRVPSPIKHAFPFAHQTTLEIFPPSSESKALLLLKQIELKIQQGFCRYSVVSRTPLATVLFAEKLKKQFPNLSITPHLTALHNTEATLDLALVTYARLGIKRLFVVQGEEKNGRDPSSKLDCANAFGTPPTLFSVLNLIKICKKAGFIVRASCHPEGHPKNPFIDNSVNNALEKEAAGCEALVTQCVYQVDALQQFLILSRQKGLKIPIIPTMMPMTNIEHLRHFAMDNHISLPDQPHNTLSVPTYYGDLMERLRRSSLLDLANKNPEIIYATRNNFDQFNLIMNDGYSNNTDSDDAIAHTKKDWGRQE